ncbi:unnamed protein product [Caenorhabditis sp. 36 PRJEB53466]|nr:unnamed protein product [Caenorhabditis sp. 36 PRJEB53466]
MRFFFRIAVLVLMACCHVATARPYESYFDEALVGAELQPRMLYKRADGGANQALVMARLQQLLGPEAFAENDSHGRLSNLQRLG